MDTPPSILETLSSNQTTICVVLIILSVSILWIYVTVSRGKVAEPNFDVLYEKPGQQSAGSKKPLKTKVKGKQVSERRTQKMVSQKGGSIQVFIIGQEDQIHN